MYNIEVEKTLNAETIVPTNNKSDKPKMVWARN